MESQLDSTSHTSQLPDTQSLSDHRHIPIRKVGIRELELPLALKISHNFEQNTIAKCALDVSLEPSIKGTHMSRFVETLGEMSKPLDLFDLKSFLDLLLEKLPSSRAGFHIECPIFLSKSAPVSGKNGPMKYLISALAEIKNGQFSQTNTLKVWVTTLCPCSKAISEFSAHNQRGEVTLKFQSSTKPDISELIEIVEKSASSELYSILKRVDEKKVTETAYLNPVFVEDLVRNIASELKNIKSLSWFQVEAENFESIHLHNAYALVNSSDFPDIN